MSGEGNGDGKDRLDRRPSQRLAPQIETASTAGIPVDEPSAENLPQQRADLQSQVDELEGVLQYMGASHPRRPSTEKRLEQLRSMLDQIDEMIGGG